MKRNSKASKLLNQIKEYDGQGKLTHYNDPLVYPQHSRMTSHDLANNKIDRYALKDDEERCIAMNIGTLHTNPRRKANVALSGYSAFIGAF
jgi:hypothetical protein